MHRIATLLAWLSIAAAPLAAVEGADTSIRPPTAPWPIPSRPTPLCDKRRRLCESGQYRAPRRRCGVGRRGPARPTRPHLVGSLQLTAQSISNGSLRTGSRGGAGDMSSFCAAGDPNPEIVAPAAGDARGRSRIATRARQAGRGRSALSAGALDLPGGFHDADPLWEARSR